MMERHREAAVWERVRSASACAPEPEPAKEEKPCCAPKTSAGRGGLSVCGNLPVLVLLVLLLRR